jgi:hypothetical protein
MRTPAATTWAPYEDPRPLRERFEFSPDWDTSKQDAARLAEALIEHWVPGRATDALRPLLVRLVGLGLKFPPKEELEEEVSESVYVMF